MDEVRYELDTGFREAPPAAEDDEMFPVNGVRSVVEPSGSSASMATRQLLELISQGLAWDKPYHHQPAHGPTPSPRHAL